MKLILLVVSLTLIHTGCARSSLPRLDSPSGDLSVSTEISGDEAGPTRRLCVILTFKDKEGSERRIQTGASNVMKWAIAWHDDDTLLLYSSDIGTYAYDISSREISERKPNKQELETGREAYRSRYGRFPNH